jgi:hypothetical protein
MRTEKHIIADPKAKILERNMLDVQIFVDSQPIVAKPK